MVMSGLVQRTIVSTQHVVRRRLVKLALPMRRTLLDKAIGAQPNAVGCKVTIDKGEMIVAFAT